MNSVIYIMASIVDRFSKAILIFLEEIYLFRLSLNWSRKTFSMILNRNVVVDMCQFSFSKGYRR